MSSRRVLIIKMSSIGDVVLALPVATALKRSDPAIHITWAVEDWTAPLVLEHPHIDRVVVFPRMRWSELSAAWWRRAAAAVRELRSAPYDVSVDLQGLARSAALVLLAGAPLRIATAKLREGAGLVSRPIDNPGRPHAADEYLRCAQFLGAADEGARFHLPISTVAARSVAARLAARGGDGAAPLIVINPSASSPHRTWAIRQWVELVDELPESVTVVLVGDDGQIARHRDIANHCARSPLDLSGQTTLPELIALLDRCAVHIAPDTGSLHIAAALGKPVVALWGPSDARRQGPYGQPEATAGTATECGALCPRFCRQHPCLQRRGPRELARLALRHLEAAGRHRDDPS